VSHLTKLHELELRGGPLTAAAAMMHLQSLTRLTTLHIDSLRKVDDEENGKCYNFFFDETVLIGQV
jgi:hypothetical protein